MNAPAPALRQLHRLERNDALRSRMSSFLLWAMMIGLLLLSGCGGGGGADTTSNPPGGGEGGGDYNGPAPQTADVQAFRLALWENVRDENRCGACHSAVGGQDPMFARSDDVNLAYAAAIMPVVNRGDPDESLLVTQVADGHFCWLTSNEACADTMENYIENWIGGSGGAVNEIELSIPIQKDVGESKNFPDDSSGFSPIHTLLTTYCADCHVDSVDLPQQPYFAVSDIDAAYDVVKSKINLDTPEDSRLVVRLGSEFHNCWDDCTANADEMETAIQTFSDSIVPTEVDPDLVISKALLLGDGIVASSGGRFETNVIALYEFKTGTGSTAFDTSGVEPAINMTFSGDVEWVGGYGIRVTEGGKAQGLTDTSQKLRDRITLTGEYSIEAWVVPGNVVQEDANIISYSGSDTSRNFTLGQTMYNYDFFHRSSTTGANGDPAHSTNDDDEDLQATLQHVVVTYDPANGRRIYVNGVFTDDIDETEGGNLSDWASNFALVFGNETSGNREWEGTLRLVAIHERALTEEQILTNFEVGVGQKFYLLFNVSDHVGLPDAYVVFAVSQFDSYSYLFEEPFFISLDETAVPNSVPMMGMRIGINGREATIGQAYRTLDTTLEAADYSAASGLSLSPTGTIIGLEKGPESDEFFLTFELLGSSSNVVVEADPIAPPTPPDGAPVSDIGVRTFDEINYSMAELTGVSITNSNVLETYETVKQQLPTTENAQTFLSSHQVAISQLAIEYCSELVDNTTLRDGFFNDGTAFNFAAPPGTAAPLGTNWEFQVVLPLVDAVTQSTDLQPMAVGPTRTDMRDELLALITRLGGSGTATNSIAKGTCAAALGSAALLVQ